MVRIQVPVYIRGQVVCSKVGFLERVLSAPYYENNSYVTHEYYPAHSLSLVLYFVIFKRAQEKSRCSIGMYVPLMMPPARKSNKCLPVC